jgi:hypothetical protein
MAYLGNTPATADSNVSLTTVQTAANQAAQLLLTAQEGDVVVRSDENKTYMHNGGSAGTMSDYTVLATPTDTVTSVNAATGAVTLTHDGFSDFVSNEHLDWTADQGSTNIHAGNYTDTNTTYAVGDGGLTTNDFTNADHTKLDGIEASADLTDATNVSSAGALMKTGGALTGAVTTNSTFDGVDIATRDGVLTSTTTTANAALPKSGGTLTGSVYFADGVVAKFGAGNDLEIYHNGSNSYINETGDGDLLIKSQGTNVKIISDGDEDIARFTKDGGAQLYYNNSKKIETSSTGIDVFGSLKFTNWTLTESGGVLYFATGGTNKAKLDASGNFTVVGDITAFGTI